eukprot:TRINITY_DN14816_c0_g1_i2.p1 TRINITY_DN14816_c0_g1~~TRINITY_DN14816_c0_g1_i2.p1  ORF type:complete len:285 (+),score=13.16 TRINITY_DN14816_c0_g1_i2:204-1058(+)
MVMDLLGTSLEDLFEKCGSKFSLKTVLMLADQMISRVQFLHQKGYMHRDLKPDNFLMGRGNQSHKLYLVDLGLAKRYFKDGKHVPYRKNKRFTGTVRYASKNAHGGIQLSRRDDLESIGYMMVYFLKGKLPWQHYESQDKKQQFQKIGEEKWSTKLETLCTGLNKEIQEYLTYCSNLKFDEEPNYEYLKKLLNDLFVKEGYEYDYFYDWTSLEFQKKATKKLNQGVYGDYENDSQKCSVNSNADTDAYGSQQRKKMKLNPESFFKKPQESKLFQSQTLNQWDQS